MSSSVPDTSNSPSVPAQQTPLKTDFETIHSTRGTIESIFGLMERNLAVLKSMYAEVIRQNKDSVFVFGLDSFHFQSKLLDVEFEDLKRQLLLINNRMYCEYYKLHKLVVEYVNTQVPEKRLKHMIQSTVLPVYKELEPYRVYPFEKVKEAHASIIALLHGIRDYIQAQELELETHRKRQNIGLNINNFVMTFEYNVRLVQEKARLFESYLGFFHDLHSKRLKHFSDKMNLLYTRMVTDVHFDDASTMYSDKAEDSTQKKSAKRVFQQNVSKLMTGLRFLKTKTNQKVEAEVDQTEVLGNDNPSNIPIMDLGSDTFGSSSTFEFSGLEPEPEISYDVYEKNNSSFGNDGA
jgi:hypothetical protein